LVLRACFVTADLNERMIAGTGGATRKTPYVIVHKGFNIVRPAWAITIG